MTIRAISLVIAMSLLLAASCQTTHQVVVILDSKDIYYDGQPVVLEVLNPGNNTIELSVRVEYKSPINGWIELGTVNHRLLIATIDSRGSRQITWEFWKSDFTVSETIKSGTYRFVLKKHTEDRTNIEAVYYSDPIIIER